MYFFYDNTGAPIAFWYFPDGGSRITGYYFTNQQGDVVRIEDPDGNVLASYSYDAWGKAYKSSGSMRNINPLRFRGYYYDTETGFYYLQSRYYDPVVSRFINADSYASTGQGFLGYNMFAYCGNDPVSRSDVSGDKFTKLENFGKKVFMGMLTLMDITQMIMERIILGEHIQKLHRPMLPLMSFRVKLPAIKPKMNPSD